MDKLLVRCEIDESNGLLKLYQQIAVLRNNKEVVISGDTVTTVEIVPVPDILARGGP